MLDRLRDGRIHDRAVGAGIPRGDRNLRRHDVGILRDRNAEQCQQARDRGDDRDHDREARPVDEDGGQHFSSRR